MDGWIGSQSIGTVEFQYIAGQGEAEDIAECMTGRLRRTGASPLGLGFACVFCLAPAGCALKIRRSSKLLAPSSWPIL